MMINYDEIFCLESESFPQLIQLIDFSIFCCEMRLTTAVYNKDKSSLPTDNTRRHPDSSHNQHSEKPSSLSELRRWIPDYITYVAAQKPIKHYVWIEHILPSGVTDR